MIGPRFALFAICLALAACRPVPPLHLGASASRNGLDMTGLLLDHGKPVPNVRIRLTSSHRPSHSMLTTTDVRGRFNIDSSGLGGTRDILRIEASGEDYHAAGEVPTGEFKLTCEIDSNTAYVPDRESRFWSGNDIEWKPGQSIGKLNCR
ncbi:hypothetical protein [Labrys sp. ZIDIC5]|uniref:hypothetical protein n=1 Tax=Labrys sedimenti TaxID=3106036 RepID=UPI002ACA2F7B|nr:hypothetical protein [Labrys sp. ZIDIC5]MDZ5454522.1 hypothetical protein [Labrys sp. ZIDIC5]